MLRAKQPLTILEARMRKLSLLLAAALVAVAAVPASAVPPPGTPAAQTAHLDFSGRGGIALWSTCPDEPAIGDICISTFLAASFVRRDNRVPVRAASALFEQFTVRVEEGPVFALLSATSASGEIELTVDRMLTSASFAAPLGAQTCVPAGGDFVCEEGVVVVSALWAGVGELERVRENSTPRGRVAGSPFGIMHLRGSFRAAQAAGAADGVPIPGEQTFGELFDSARSFVIVCRGGPSVDPADCPAP